jgi:hypothetical protein
MLAGVRHLVPRLALLSLLGLACGPGAEDGAGGAEPAEAPAVPIAGMYEVSGVTVTAATGDERAISGSVILAEDGARYTATFNLTTTYPGAEEALPAEVIGKGEGTIDGRTLLGTAQTQLVMATVPGVDPGFAYIPRLVSTRIVSDSVTTIARDGTVHIEIENSPAEGEDYASTRTTLRGRRVSAAGVGSAARSE